MMRKAGCLTAALLAMSACAGSPASHAGKGARTDSPAATASRQHRSPVWKLKWQTDFAEPAPLGSFSGCNNNERTPAAYCSALPVGLRSQWWAYPYLWPDSATEVHKPVGGYYDPAHTVWISGGQMHIRMFRTTTWVHVAAVVPKASIGMLYGKYVERAMVSPNSDPGYGSAHLLWPTGTPIDYEVDFPEGDWDYNYCLHVHSIPEGTKTRDLCPASAKWAQWNTTEIDWWPGNVTFYLNGQLIYHVTGKWVPNQLMSWIIQNQAALKAPWAKENSAGQLNISYVAVYSYAGERG
jgi:hypothetical protein